MAQRSRSTRRRTSFDFAEIVQIQEGPMPSCSLFLLFVSWIMLSPCGASIAPSLDTLRLHVSRLAETVDEAGKPFAKVFVKGHQISQDVLDCRLVSGAFPELMFTDKAQKEMFDLFKAQSLPVELHVEDKTTRNQTAFSALSAATGEPGMTDAYMTDAGIAGVGSHSDDAYTASYGNMAVHQLLLKDQPRCAWYKAELERTCQGALVLDVGSVVCLSSYY